MRLLVVDDEPMITSALARLLGTDYDVTVAGDGRVALDRISRGERFDAIICDLMMPELTGMGLYTELARLAPDQAARMIFMTGGVFTSEDHAFLDQVPNARIQKPFAIATLEVLVRALR